LKKQNATASQPKQDQAAESPMSTGMGMGKKMKGQMGRGGGPLEMMQKMMAQMSQGEGKAQMEKMMSMCMGMCSDMMTSMRQTNALAVHVTPELQHIFGEWLKQLEDKALGLVEKGTVDAADLARSLKITEDSALYVLHRLAASGKITLAGKLRR
jgi:hypothetical protein